MAQKEEVYVMEKILDKRISSKDGKLEYLIAWENFGPEDNTWEPQSNIFCPVMLKNFEERRAGEKRNRKGNPIPCVDIETVESSSGTLKSSGKSTHQRCVFTIFFIMFQKIQCRHLSLEYY